MFIFEYGGLTPYCLVIQNGDSKWRVKIIFEYAAISRWQIQNSGLGLKLLMAA
jgi:hypothetical protein